MRLPRDPQRRLCVICEKIYPEGSQPGQTSVLLPPPVTLPPIQSVQQPLPPIPPAFGIIDQTGSKDLIDRAYRSLAAELVRLTESLARYDTGSKDYDDYLARIHRVVDTMHTMRK